MASRYLGLNKTKKTQTVINNPHFLSRTKKNKTHTKGRGSYLRGWSKSQPGYHDRTVMMNKCGDKCFLGPNKTFPICRRNTCRIDRRGVEAAYIRAREYTTIRGSRKYKQIANKAYKQLYPSK
jgi:hypothetical protein